MVSCFVFFLKGHRRGPTEHLTAKALNNFKKKSQWRHDSVSSDTVFVLRVFLLFLRTLATSAALHTGEVMKS